MNQLIFDPHIIDSRFLKAQLLSYNIDVTVSLHPSLMGRLAILAISFLFVDRFARSLRFKHLEFDKKAIYDDYRSEKAELLWYC